MSQRSQKSMDAATNSHDDSVSLWTISLTAGRVVGAVAVNTAMLQHTDCLSCCSVPQQTLMDTASWTNP